MQNLKGFTLVELIVVITIVGILSTVGFVSYSNYLTGARDSNRISQMIKLSDSLQVYAATKSLPLPDNKVDITASGTIIAYQGYAGNDVLETLDYTNGGIDPKDDSYFTYYVTKDRKNMQLLAFMEENQTNIAYFPKSYATDYEERFPKVYGQKLGVLTDTNNTPIQELSITGSTLDVLTTTLKLKSYLTESEYVVDNLSTLPQLQELVPQSGKFWTVKNNAFVPPPTTYPGCDTEDIRVGSYTIAACNVGATVSGTGAISYGRLFQWGENIAWDASSGVTASNNCTWNRDMQSCTTPSISSWSTTVSDITNGGIDRWFDYGDIRGPCANGYHVPTDSEWAAIIVAGSWGVNGVARQNELLIPYAGYRLNGTLSGLGVNVSYWSTTPYATNTLITYFSSGSVATTLSYLRNNGFSVRCFKN